MALVDSYALCPCGSGEKYKWCCQKAESFAERSIRLQRSGQIEPAIAATDEGLKKHPDTAWLLMRKAILLTSQHKLNEAMEVVRQILFKQPGHVGARDYLVRLATDSEGALAGVLELQQALSATKKESQGSLAATARVLGVILAQTGHVPAGLAHIRLANALDPELDPSDATSEAAIEESPSLSAWLRNPYRLAPVPETARETTRAKFSEAIAWAEEGLWSSAGSAFEILSAEGLPGADLNLGLCRLWIGDNAAASAAFKRHAARARATSEAVDIEALRQRIAPLNEDIPVERLELTWPVKDREGLLKRLNADPAIFWEGRGPVDPDDPDSPEVDNFLLLDRPKLTDFAGKGPNDYPKIEARLAIAKTAVALDVFDDGRLDRVKDKFIEAAGPTIPPAHPKTKVLEKLPRSRVMLSVELWLPEKLSSQERSRIRNEENAWIIREVWPKTPEPYLGRKSPLQVKGDPAMEVPLRAAISQFEFERGFWGSEIDYAGLRAAVGVPDEPSFDPQTVDIDAVHIARLQDIPAEPLDDDKLVRLFQRARQFHMRVPMENSALALIKRDNLLNGDAMSRVTVYSSLVNLALERQNTAAALDWEKRGRASDRNPKNSVHWDFLELAIYARTQKPEEWVPTLAVILERYSRDADASSHVLSNLVQLGLARIGPNPENPEQLLLDTTELQALINRYGPKVTTASGKLGVSATSGEIWTPEKETPGSSSGLWTPGSPAPASSSGEKPKLILPSR